MYVFIYVYIFMLTNLLTYHLYLFYTNFIFFVSGSPDILYWEARHFVSGSSDIFSCFLVGFAFPGLNPLTKY
jgi:hypothetical protein